MPRRAFAVAVAFGALWPRARPLLWAYAVLIAVSRVVVTAHHPSDVLAGALVGAFGALLVRDWFAARRLGVRAAARTAGPGRCRGPHCGASKGLPGSFWPHKKHPQPPVGGKTQRRS